jgi:hypothetical protein
MATLQLWLKKVSDIGKRAIDGLDFSNFRVLLRRRSGRASFTENFAAWAMRHRIRHSS